VLLLSGKLAPVKAAAGGAGLAFLHQLGYAPRNGFWCLASGAACPRPKWRSARGALGRAMGDELYLLAETLAESK
jgi:hypothetical protein